MIQNYDEFVTERQRALGFPWAAGAAREYTRRCVSTGRSSPQELRCAGTPASLTPTPGSGACASLREQTATSPTRRRSSRGSGCIAREWYPFFMSVRRQGMTFEEMWESGRVTELSRRIYEAVRDNGRVAMHDIKRLAGLSGETSAHIEKAMTDLQMSMLLTICGRQQKRNALGELYGWSSTVFCTPEEFWHTEDTGDIPPEEAAERIRARVLELNPDAQERKIRKFIYG